MFSFWKGPWVRGKIQDFQEEATEFYFKADSPDCTNLGQKFIPQNS